MTDPLSDAFISELEKLGGPRSPVMDRSIRNLVGAFKGYSHHKRKEWAVKLEAAARVAPALAKGKYHHAAASRYKRSMSKRFSDLVAEAMLDEMAKAAGWPDVFRPERREKPKDPLDVVIMEGIKRDAEAAAEGEAPGWRRVARRMVAFLGGGLRARGAEHSAAKQIQWHPGTTGPKEIFEAVDAMNQKYDPGNRWWLNYKPPQGVPGIAVTLPDGRDFISVIPGQRGTALHEAGHFAARSMPGMNSAAYLKARDLSREYGWLMGLGLLPNALLDDPTTRPALSKWGPAMALLPSVPTLAEETTANILGGTAAAQQGNLGEFAAQAMPGYATHILRAATVPAGLWMVDRMKRKELAAQEAANAAREARLRERMSNAPA